MPIESHVDEERRCVIARVFGNVTIEEILEAITRSVEDPKFRPGFGILSDHTEVDEPLTPAQAQRMVEHLKSLADFMAGSRWAVATSKPASYGMIRMVSALAESIPMDVQAFSSYEEAQAWIAREGEPR